MPILDTRVVPLVVGISRGAYSLHKCILMTNPLPCDLKRRMLRSLLFLHELFLSNYLTRSLPVVTEVHVLLLLFSV